VLAWRISRWFSHSRLNCKQPWWALRMIPYVADDAGRAFRNSSSRPANSDYLINLIRTTGFPDRRSRQCWPIPLPRPKRFRSCPRPRSCLCPRPRCCPERSRYPYNRATPYYGCPAEQCIAPNNRGAPYHRTAPDNRGARDVLDRYGPVCIAYRNR
jgi:hypothetical protein